MQALAASPPKRASWERLQVRQVLVPDTVSNRLHEAQGHTRQIVRLRDLQEEIFYSGVVEGSSTAAPTWNSRSDNDESFRLPGM